MIKSHSLSLTKTCRRYFSCVMVSPKKPHARLNYIKINSSNPQIKNNLLAVHGMFGSINDFHQIVSHEKIQSLVNSVLIDLRNHGNSEHIDEMSLDDFSGDIYKLVSSQKLDNLVLMGHSLGGRIVTKFCVNHPELVKAAIIVDVLPVNYFDFKDKFRVMDGMHRVVDSLANLNLNRNFEDIKQDVRKITNNESSANYILANILQVGIDCYVWKCNMKAMSERMDSHSIENINPGFDKRYEGKVKIIFGEKSGFLTSVKDLESFHQVFSNYNEDKDVEFIKGGGHYAYITHTNQFIDLISKFLKTV